MQGGRAGVVLRTYLCVSGAVLPEDGAFFVSSARRAKTGRPAGNLSRLAAARERTRDDDVALRAAAADAATIRPLAAGGYGNAHQPVQGHGGIGAWYFAGKRRGRRPLGALQRFSLRHGAFCFLPRGPYVAGYPRSALRRPCRSGRHGLCSRPARAVATSDADPAAEYGNAAHYPRAVWLAGLRHGRIIQPQTGLGYACRRSGRHAGAAGHGAGVRSSV